MPKNKTTKTPASASLLVELLTEELPPKNLERLSAVFAREIFNGLNRRGFLSDTSAAKSYASPRRLAVLITEVASKALDRPVRVKIVPVAIGIDKSGKPTLALTKKLANLNLSHAAFEELKRATDGKTEFFIYEYLATGESLRAVLELTLEETVKALPTPKVMSYPLPVHRTTNRTRREDISDSVQFVRPARCLVALHGEEIVPVDVLGLEAGRTTQGHRFLASGPITIKRADDYEYVLRKDGRVEVSFEIRRSRVKEELKRVEQELAGHIARSPNGRIPINVQPVVIDTERAEPPAQVFPQSFDLDAVERALNCSGRSALLDEVTALVEWPRAYWGHFDKQFLEIPVECLTLTMKQNQKYFPVFDASAQLLPYFVVISNIDNTLARNNADQISKNIVSGNERVLRPRLADARFFFEHDKKIRLEARVSHLADVVYHNKLGSQLERVDHIQLLTKTIAGTIGANLSFAERAARLSKADLITEMVGEFPELQGVMGRYYALHDGEPELVADAIETHYRPRFAGDRLPEGLVACAVALADKLYTLIAMFAIGEVPTGEKDPFALRRNALGVVRILVETPLKLDAFELLRAAEATFPKGFLKYPPQLLRDFIRERLRSYLRERKGDVMHVEAVVDQLGGLLYQAPARLDAVRNFAKLPEAQDLAIANKRVLNIIRKNEEIGYAFKPPERSLMKDHAETALMDAVERLAPVAQRQFDAGDYEGSMRLLAGIKADVDRFFDEVMVMVEDVEVRNNRAALLQELGKLMNRVANISKLAIEK